MGRRMGGKGAEGEEGGESEEGGERGRGGGRWRMEGVVIGVEGVERKTDAGWEDGRMTIKRRNGITTQGIRDTGEYLCL
jgi:hypothetical protein